MIDLEFVESLIRAMDESGLDSIELERGGTRIKLNKTPPAPPQAPAPAAPAPQLQAHAPSPGATGPGSAPTPPAADADGDDGDDGGGGGDPDLIEVTSPMVGTFYRAPSPEAPPYVEVGDRVAAGETLCIIEAMKLMNELECESPGTIEEICVEDAEPVEYGQVLFRMSAS